MTFTDAFRRHAERSIALFEELVATLPESALAQRLPGLPSCTLGHQLWCVVGARESYARALQAGAWQGFSCSLRGNEATSTTDVARALAHSAAELRAVLDGLESLDDERCRLALDLLEHEASHQGQLIRYLYALRLPIPPGWKVRYSLD
jgi:hypothetical protein